MGVSELMTVGRGHPECLCVCINVCFSFPCSEGIVKAKGRSDLI